MTRHRVDPKAILCESEYLHLKGALKKARSTKVQEILTRLEITFRAYEPAKVAQAEAEYHKDGEIEIDDGAVCSRGTDPGCYVQAWVWVYDAEKAK